MELYIGGISQGKLKYVCDAKKMERGDRRICDGGNCSLKDLFTMPVINHLHLFIRRLVTEGEERNAGLPKIDLSTYTHLKDMAFTDTSRMAETVMEELIAKNPSAIIICNEVGYGIVPADRTDRLYRETVGRCLCRLADGSASVVRIVCGLGMKIK